MVACLGMLRYGIIVPSIGGGLFSSLGLVIPVRLQSIYSHLVCDSLFPSFLPCPSVLFVGGGDLVDGGQREVGHARHRWRKRGLETGPSIHPNVYLSVYTG